MKFVILTIFLTIVWEKPLVKSENAVINENEREIMNPADTDSIIERVTSKHAENTGSDNEALYVTGRYSFIGTDDKLYETVYGADENGFRQENVNNDFELPQNIFFNTNSKVMRLILFVIFLNTAFAKPQPVSEDAVIITYERESDESGGYRFSYQTSDLQSREEQGVIKNPGTDNEALSVTGSYSFLGTDSKMYRIFYMADENGFQHKKGRDTPEILFVIFLYAAFAKPQPISEDAVIITYERESDESGGYTFSKLYRISYMADENGFQHKKDKGPQLSNIFFPPDSKITTVKNRINEDRRKLINENE
ncbi:Cuticular protein 65Av [Carabus blaptoides fortunei]